MNAEPKKNERPSLRVALKQTVNRLWLGCAHNWGWKLLSVFLAVSLWAGLITQDPTLTRERVFTDVPVSVTGMETLIRNGLVILSGLEEDALSIRLRVDVPQRAYSAASAGNYNPRVDVSRITDTGEQTLRIQTTSSTSYGTVDAVSPESVTVTVDEYVTNYRVPVSLNITGEYPNGYYGMSPLLDPGTVAVSGPKSIVDRIVNLYVDYDVSRLAAHEGLVRSALAYRFADADGNEISNSLLSVTSASVVLRTITVEQRLYPTRTLSVSSLVATEGTPASGYEVKSMKVSPDMVLVAGNSESLETLDTLFSDIPVNIEQQNESFTVEIPLRKPGGVSYMSTDTVTLMVEIQPIITSQTFTGIRVSARGKADRTNAMLSVARVSLGVTGPQNVLKSLSPGDFEAYVNVEGLLEGTHSVPVTFRVLSDHQEELQIEADPDAIDVTITAQ